MERHKQQEIPALGRLGCPVRWLMAIVLDCVPSHETRVVLVRAGAVWIVDGFWLLYRLILGALATVTLVVSLIAMVLWCGCGIRWAW